MSEDRSTGTNPLGIRGVVPLPTPEEAAREQRGVVFYRIVDAKFSRAQALDVVIGVYRLVTETGPGKHASEGPYEMRLGLRLDLDEEGRYWVGFNHVAFGAMFEQALRAARQQPRARISGSIHT